MNLVKTSYSPDDVTVLLKDFSGVMKPLSVEEREHAIDTGTHYSEMLPKEDPPSAAYAELYTKSLERSAKRVAKYIAHLATIMIQQCVRGKPIIVSLARAGTPVGILIKRYILQKFGVDCAHYTISIIRDKGIDVNAMKTIYQNEVASGTNYVENIFFVDGWTGKGAIKTQLAEAVVSLKAGNECWRELHDWLFVLADPGCITPYCATRADWLLPSACLNSTVSGLISRSILNKYIDVAAGDYHGAVYFEEFEAIDQSNRFLDTITAEFPEIPGQPHAMFSNDNKGMSVVMEVCKAFHRDNCLKIKPGVGETTRVLLRRKPGFILFNNTVDKDDPDLAHIFELCKQKNVPYQDFPLGNYKVCGIICDASADA